HALSWSARRRIDRRSLIFGENPADRAFVTAGLSAQEAGPINRGMARSTRARKWAQRAGVAASMLDSARNAHRQSLAQSRRDPPIRTTRTGARRTRFISH